MPSIRLDRRDQKQVYRSRKPPKEVRLRQWVKRIRRKSLRYTHVFQLKASLVAEFDLFRPWVYVEHDGTTWALEDGRILHDPTKVE